MPNTHSDRIKQKKVLTTVFFVAGLLLVTAPVVANAQQARSPAGPSGGLGQGNYRVNQHDRRNDDRIVCG